jgi:hypothetical protein
MSRTANVRISAVAAIVLACGVLMALPAPAPAAHPLETAIDPSAAFGAQLGLAYERIRQSGASTVKLTLAWKEVAPAGPPASFDPADPDDRHYDWGGFDTQVRFAADHGLQPLVTIDEAPSWAERGGGGRPGTNNPDPAELALFAQAAARRYAGDFNGLPRVRLWEAWNEPNGSFFLYPQRSRTQLLSPDQYRRMLNAFAGAIHGVRPDNVVIAGALFPFTVDRPGSQSIGPLAFMRALFCLTKDLTPLPGCEPVRFDVWSHHPYTSGGPTHVAGNPDSVSIRELPQMADLLRAAIRAGRVVSSAAVRFWVTEFSWDSNPPDPDGVPTGLLRRWVSEALYRMWRSGVSLVTWFKLRDDATLDRPSNATFQSGLYFRCEGSLSCDRPKPSLRAFRFPFVAFRSGRRLYFWGRAPSGKQTRVIVQQKVGHRWKRLRILKTNGFGIFSKRIRTHRRGRLRALLRDGSDRSAAFSLTRPPDLSVNPFG